MKRFLTLAVVLAMTVLAASFVYADVPQLINYQGRLTDNAGDPMDTTVLITFTIYDAATDGDSKWTETHSSVDVAEGLFNVLLGSTVPIDDSVFNGPDRYLGIKVGNDDEIEPRTRLISVPYAYHALRADTADYATAADDGDWEMSGEDIYRLSGNIGMGTMQPQARLDIAGGNYDLTGSEGDLRIGSDDYRLKIGVRTDVDGGDVFIRPEGGTGRLFLGTGRPYYALVLEEKGVGLGISSPEARLHVRATSFYNTGFKLETDGNRQMTLAHISRATGATDDGSTYAALLIEDTYSAAGTPIALRVHQSRWTGQAAYFSGGYGVRIEDLRLDEASITSLNSQHLTLSPASGNVQVDGSVTATTYYGDGSNLTGISGTTDNDWIIDGENIYHPNGNVGIGTSSPSSMLELRKEVGGATTLFKISGYEGDRNSVIVRSNGNVLEVNHHGYNTGQKALYVNHDGSGYGAYILGTTYLEGNVGIGTFSPTNKLDVRETGTGAAVYAESQSIASNIGAVTGRAKAQGGSGVYGETWESGAPGQGSSLGVFGWAAHQGATTGGGCIGVMGKTDAFRGSGAEVPMGVYGEATHTTGVCWGVAGETRSTHADAVGVKGTLLTAGSFGKAVLGVGASPGWAGYFQGDVNVTGTIVKSGGGFKIDHPLDPANRFLQHSSVESPDMKNVYDGVAMLDANGEAVIGLPDYFEALNKDFRYQLTAIGAPAPNLYIAEEMADNQFKIAGGEPGMKVSWMMTGIRIDPFAMANRIQVEKDKPDYERGSYLHPKDYSLNTE